MLFRSLLNARRELVAPRHVIGRARGEDFDLRVPRQMFGDVPRMELGAAVHRLPVALDDDGDLHCGSGSPLRSGAGAGGGSAPEDSRRVSAASAAGAGTAPPSSPPSYSSTASASDTEIASPAIVPAVSDVLCAAGQAHSLIGENRKLRRFDRLAEVQLGVVVAILHVMWHSVIHCGIGGLRQLLELCDRFRMAH